MQRSVLEKYGLQNTTLMDVFDRMMNTGSAYNFTDEEIEMFKYIERQTLPRFIVIIYDCIILSL